MSDICCVTCGEPWDADHLRHEIWSEIPGAKPLVYTLRRHRKSPLNDPQMGPYWRTEFKILGWEFLGGDTVIPITCPCCRANGKESKGILRRKIEAVAASAALEHDLDALTTTLEDQA